MRRNSFYFGIALLLAWAVALGAQSAAPTILDLQPSSYPLSSLPVTLRIFGQNFGPDSQVTLNGRPLPTSFSSATRIEAALSPDSVPGPGMFDVGVTNITTVLSAPPVRFFLNIPGAFAEMVYDRLRDRLYISREFNGEIVAVRPQNGATVARVPFLDRPKELALSDDTQALWVGLNNGRVARFRTEDLTQELTFDGPPGSAVQSLRAVPGRNDAVIVVRRTGTQTVSYTATLIEGRSQYARETPASAAIMDVVFAGSVSDLWGLSQGCCLVRLRMTGDGLDVDLASAIPATSSLPGLVWGNGRIYASGDIIDLVARRSSRLTVGRVVLAEDGRTYVMEPLRGLFLAYPYISMLYRTNDPDLRDIRSAASSEPHRPGILVPYAFPPNLVRWAPDGFAMLGNPGSGLIFELNIFRSPIAAPAPVLSQDGIVNSASFQAGNIAPREILSIFAGSIGPTYDAYGLVTGPALLTKTLGGVQVLFDGEPAPLLFAGPNQINLIVPKSVGSRSSVRVQVSNSTVLSQEIVLAVAPAAPALFTLTGTGAGQAAALNQDFTLNSADRPAAPGSIVMLYATGLGALAPDEAEDGRIITNPLPGLAQTMRVTIGGREAEILYAGAAPNFVAGAYQINARVPRDLPPGPAAVILAVAGTSSRSDVTVTVGTAPQIKVQIVRRGSGLAPGFVGLYQVNAQVPQNTPTGNLVPVMVSAGDRVLNSVTNAFE